MSPNDPSQYSQPDSQMTSQSKPSEPIPELVHDYTHPILDSPKHPYHPKRVMIGLIAIVVLALLSVAAMLLFALLPMKNTAKPAKTQQTNVQSTKQDSLSAKETISHLSVYFKGKNPVKTGITLPVKAPGSAYYTVIPETTDVVGMSGEISADMSDQQRDSIEKSLDYDQFTKQVMSDGSNHTNYLADYSRSDVVCELSITKPTDVKADQLFDMKCQDMSTYTAYAKRQAQWVSLYASLTATSVRYGFVGMPVVHPSTVANYNITQLQVSTVVDNRMASTGKYAQFYQTPDGLWHYLQDQDEGTLIMCDQYMASNDLRSAYAGQQCRSKTGTVSTVIPPTKKS